MKPNPSSEAGLLNDFDMIVGLLPSVKGHEGSCGPEAGCDAACMDAASLSDAISRVRAALAKEARDAGAREGLEERVLLLPRKEFDKLGDGYVRLSDVLGLLRAAARDAAKEAGE